MKMKREITKYARNKSADKTKGKAFN
uniref:Uncharacterized protein n=1 Tax=Rhizophora mucronata TaxID=61149 RepID=A0A2P2PVI6_RHIMU